MTRTKVLKADSIIEKLSRVLKHTQRNIPNETRQIPLSCAMQLELLNRAFAHCGWQEMSRGRWFSARSGGIAWYVQTAYVYGEIRLNATRTRTPEVWQPLTDADKQAYTGGDVLGWWLSTFSKYTRHEQVACVARQLTHDLKILGKALDNPVD